MKQINHHLSDSLLMAYVAGDLPEAHNLVVATHVSVCDECRARLGAYETLGGAVMASSAASDFADLDAGLAACFDKIDRAGHEPAPRRTRAMGVFPAPLVDYVGGGLDAVRWRSVGMGVKQAILPTARGSKARLLYIPPGQAVPDHGHRGLELTLVLQGSFHTETARFAAGDVEIADEDVEHTPIADAGDVCICLAATDAPLRFHNLIPRLVQPFIRI